MSNTARKISVNIFMLMQNTRMSCEDLAKKLNYSYRDMCRIFEGELMLPPSEIKKIADFFGITKRELLHYEVGSFVSE